MFAIPANQEFVFLETEENLMKEWTSFYLNSLISFCSNPNTGKLNFLLSASHILTEQKWYLIALYIFQNKIIVTMDLKVYQNRL